jgi:hypothetical protein
MLLGVRIAELLQWLATGWTVRVSDLCACKRVSPTRSDRPWHPPSVLYNGYRDQDLSLATRLRLLPRLEMSKAIPIFPTPRSKPLTLQLYFRLPVCLDLFRNSSGLLFILRCSSVCTITAYGLELRVNWLVSGQSEEIILSHKNVNRHCRPPSVLANTYWKLLPKVRQHGLEVDSLH